MKILIFIITILFLSACFSKKSSAPSTTPASTITQYELNVNDGIIGSSSTSPLTKWNSIPNVDHYEISIGTGKGKNDVKDWLDVGLANESTINIPSNISTNTYLYTNIRAFDSYNNIIANSSGDGWTVVNDFVIKNDPINFNSYVTSIEIDEYGNKYIGGLFNAIDGQNVGGILALTSTGAISSGYNFGNVANGKIYKLTNGKFILWGHNGTYNNASVKKIIRLNSNGTLDTGFDLSNTINNYNIVNIKTLSNNEIIVAYYVSGVGYKIAKIGINGLYDSSFSTTFTNIYSNYINISTSENAFYITSNNLIQKFNLDGTTDSSSSLIHDVGLLNDMKDGNIIQTNSYYLHLYDTNLNEDSSFLNNTINAKICSPQEVTPTTITGKYIVSYYECDTNIMKLAKINRDGTIDATFKSNFGKGLSPQSAIFKIAIDNSNKIYISSNTSFYNEEPVPLNLFRINVDGTLDSNFISNKAGFNSNIETIIPDGTNVIMSGYFTTFGGTFSGSLVKLNKLNELENFKNTVIVNAPITDIKIKNGFIYIAGDFTKVNGKRRSKIAKLNLDGSLTNDFNFTGFNDNSTVNKITIQKDNRIMAIGDFKTYNQYASNSIVRIHPDGSRDSSFSSIFSNGTYFSDLGTQSDGKILLLITSTMTIQNTTVNRFFRLNQNGTLDIEYANKIGTGFNNYISSLITLKDDSSIFCGYQSSFNGQTTKFITKIKKDGSIDLDFKFPNEYIPTGDCQKISLTPNNQVLIGGNFTNYDNTEHFNVFTILPNGDLDRNYDAGISNYNTNFLALKQSYDGEIYSGGIFEFNSTSYLKLIGW